MHRSHNSTRGPPREGRKNEICGHSYQLLATLDPKRIRKQDDGSDGGSSGCSNGHQYPVGTPVGVCLSTCPRKLVSQCRCKFAGGSFSRGFHLGKPLSVPMIFLRQERQRKGLFSIISQTTMVVSTKLSAHCGYWCYTENFESGDSVSIHTKCFAQV